MTERPAVGLWATIARRVAGVTGWRRYGLAWLLGAIAALALAPIHAVPVLLVSFTGLVWQLGGVPSARSGFAVGWWFGAGYFVAGLYWIMFALLTDPEKFAWMIPFAIGGLSTLLAMFIGLATLSTRLVPSGGAAGVFLLAAGWAAMEWARGTVLTGFPWNTIGNVWAFSPTMMQFASVTGVYGLGLVTVAIAAAPSVLGGSAGRGRIPVLIAGLALAVLWAGGATRLADVPESYDSTVKLRLVQANIAQDHKWRSDLRARQFEKYLRLSRQPFPDNSHPTHVIWPETAAPFFLADEPRARRAMARVVSPGGALITGTLRSESQPGQPQKIWNSLQAIDNGGVVLGSSDKFHLVPFGEIQQQVVLSAPPALRIVIYRRLMMRISERLASVCGAQALVTGEAVGQVASQTLENISTINEVVNMPVLRPLIGSDKEEITREARRLGTYPISIIPDQDCCTLFMPRSPATKARLADVQRAEDALPIAGMVDTAVERAESKEFVFP